MMYIEHTPLEDNLQDIIRRSTLLAHVHADANNDDARHTHSQLHFGVPERIALANYRAAIGGDNLQAATATNHLQVAGAVAATATAATANGFECGAANIKYLKYNNIHENNIQNYNNHSATIKPTNQKVSLPPPPPPLLPTSKLCVDAIVDDDEEEYELIEVFDQEFNGEQAKSTNLNEIQVQTAKNLENSENYSAKVLPEETLPSEITFQIETGDDQVEYILTRKSNNKRNLEQTEPTPQQHQSQRKKPLRPIPAAIPIATAFYGASRRRRILNGSYPTFNDDVAYDEDEPSTSHWQQPKPHRYTGEQTRWVVKNDTPIQVVDNNEQDSPMGILTKLRQLLHLHTNDNLEAEDRSRKRRLEAQNSNTNNQSPPHQFKYRKVSDNFPELITHTVEDDDLDLISAYPINRNSRQNSFTRPDNFTIMAERKNFNSLGAPKMRKSIFAVPETTHKLVKNTSYADIEFSDDDELELVKGFGMDLEADNGNGSAGGGSLRKGAPTVYNIPVRHYRTDEQQRAKYATKLPPPPLIEACNTCNRSVPSMMTQLDLARRPIVPDSFRQHQQQQQQHQQSRMAHVVNNLMNEPLGSLASSSGDSIFASIGGGYKSFNKSRLNPWSTNAHSILAQEKETEEREKYRQLLEQVVPRLYGGENSQLQLQLPKSLKSIREFDTPRQNGFFGENTSTLSFLGAGERKAAIPSRKSTTYHSTLKRPPLSSTINLDDEDEEEEQLEEQEEDDDDVTVTGVTQLHKQRTPKDVTMTVIIDDDDDDDISEIVDLDEDERNVIAACNKLKSSNISSDKAKHKHKSNENELPFVEPVNSLQDRFRSSPHLNDNWLQKWQLEWKQKRKARLKEVDEAAKLAEKLSVERRTAESEIRERLKNFQIIDPDLVIIDDFPEPVEEPEFVALTPDHQARIKAAICGPTDQVLITKFNLNITRRDIHTLLGHNWLNDEVINFYMNLLTERGDKKHDSQGMPLVYAMNTFFVPRLMQAGHGGVKRWTRKIDIFAKDIIPVPVHVGGVHWCMAIIHIRNRTIKYYDSMGTPNPNVLRALEQYLKDESLDKRKQSFDTSQFVIESVQDVPRQMNGSDCGVFSCMFAEYITRNREITFSQQNMEYFRHKMILEIVQGELLH